MSKDINPKIQFARYMDVKNPTKANQHDAGTDFFIPYYSFEFIKEYMKMNRGTRTYSYVEGVDDDGHDICHLIIPAHTKILIPSGIRVNILDKRTFLNAKNKSGIATKLGLIKTAEIIDADYQGMLFFGLVNVTDEKIEVTTGQKIIQLVQEEYIPSEYEEISIDDYEKLDETDRGEGSRGSSGV